MAINIRPYENNLRSSAGPSINSYQTNNAATNYQIKKTPAKLSINTDNQTQSSRTDSQNVQSDRQRVASKTSSQLFSSAASLSSRSTLNESLALGVDQLKTLAYKIKDEVDPTKKADLVTQANEIVTSLQSQYNKAVSQDPNLAKDVSITSLVKPGADLKDGSKVAQVFIEKVVSPTDSGLSSINFNDPDAAISQLEASAAIYSQKQTSYISTGSEIAGATKKALTDLEAKAITAEKDREEENAKNLAEQITNSTQNLLTQSKLSENTVQMLLENKEEDDDTEEESSSSRDETKNTSTQKSSSYKVLDEESEE